MGSSRGSGSVDIARTCSKKKDQKRKLNRKNTRVPADEFAVLEASEDEDDTVGLSVGNSNCV